jgi:hypothetical protein
VQVIPEGGSVKGAGLWFFLQSRGSTVGCKAVVDGYEKRMLQMTRGALPDFSGSLRRHLYRQAERLAAFVHDEGATWSGLSWR